jgi:hypothetical protein
MCIGNVGRVMQKKCERVSLFQERQKDAVIEDKPEERQKIPEESANSQ